MKTDDQISRFQFSSECAKPLKVWDPGDPLKVWDPDVTASQTFELF